MERMYDLLSISTKTILLAAALYACGPKSGETNPESGTTTQSTTDPTKGNSFIDPNPSQTEVYCTIDEFRNLVHHGTPSAHSEIAETTIQFTVGSYQAIVGEMPICIDTMGMVIHYGFDAEADTLSLAFSFACMTIDKDDMGWINTPDSPLYTIDENNKLSAVPTTLTEWRGSIGKAFKDNIVVDKYDHKKFQYIYKDIDPYMVYKFSQIDNLIEHNKLASTDWVEVVAIAEPIVWPKPDRGAYFSMRTCLVAKDATGRLINDTPPPAGSMYENRGSDLGSPCPVACGDYAVFMSKGVDIRSTCKP
jgi:hypothetical protein